MPISLRIFHNPPQKKRIFIPKERNAKECSTYLTIVLISHASKVILKFLQARLQWYAEVQIKILPRVPYLAGGRTRT